MDLDFSSALLATAAGDRRQPEASGSGPGPIRDGTASGEVKKKERGPRVVRACDVSHAHVDRERGAAH